MPEGHRNDAATFDIEVMYITKDDATMTDDHLMRGGTSVVCTKLINQFMDGILAKGYATVAQNGTVHILPWHFMAQINFRLVQDEN